ncbi:MerR family transcriptional regulator [Krasilnikovia sp. MM14-A1259]|uniref:MerR family transcriptional regulator n=1 Tax=Krasilnikovia sp. MM14-A1259 TaxID=3373539 RepID=UPI00382E36F1
MLIGELAEHAGVTPRMVRHYANAGLVSSTRDVNGYRDFEHQQVVRVRQVQSLIGLGLTIAQIVDLLPCLGEKPETPTCPAARDALRQRLSVIDGQMSVLTGLRERIAATLDLSVEHSRTDAVPLPGAPAQPVERSVPAQAPGPHPS